jgi:homoserine O-acetyltransferase
MQVLQWMVAYPQRICAAVPIATTLKHTPQQIAFNEVGRQAVMADVNWKNGNYYSSQSPANGLAVARMIGHITYMSDVSMAEKFGRRTKVEQGRAQQFSADLKWKGI